MSDKAVKEIHDVSLGDRKYCNRIDCEICEQLRNTPMSYQQLEAESSRRLELLKRCEWVVDAGVDYYLYCPICQRSKIDGHAADCELAKEFVGEHEPGLGDV